MAKQTKPVVTQSVTITDFVSQKSSKMKKLKVFTVLKVFMPLTLLALGLVLVSCRDNDGTTIGNPCTVTFNINGGSGTTPSAQTASSGSSITLPGGSGLIRTGYTFGGWNTNSSGMGTNYDAGSSYTVTGTATLYARWVKISYTETRTNNLDHISSSSRNETITPGFTTDLLKQSGYNRVTIEVWYSFRTDILGGTLRLQIASRDNRVLGTKDIDNLIFDTDWHDYGYHSVTVEIDALNNPTCEFMLLWSKQGVSDYYVGERTITIKAIQ
jgi:uncharacterized repeat protein (TIGR02543 family)